MEHKDIEELIVDYLDGELDEEGEKTTPALVQRVGGKPEKTPRMGRTVGFGRHTRTTGRL